MAFALHTNIRTSSFRNYKMLSEFQLPFLLPHPFLYLLSLFCLGRDAGPVFEHRTRSQKIGVWLSADTNLLHAVDQII